MSEAVASYIGSLTPGFFMNQVITIFLLTLLGSLVTVCACKGKSSLLYVLLYFPAGLSIYALISFVLLVSGIHFDRLSVTLPCAAAAVIAAVLIIKNKWSITGGFTVKQCVIGIITMLCIIVISTCGILSVSVTNDSMYYYLMYPKALVHFGYLRRGFNVFLTDIGQMSAIINTLPYMYGFNESFGILTFLNIDTLLLFACAVYEAAAKQLDKKKAAAACIMMTLILISSMPYVIMSKWMMSNSYFMCFMFICVYLSYRIGSRKEAAPEAGELFILGIMFAVMSFLRMEGCMIALILTVCFATLDYTNRQLAVTFLMPILLIAVSYDIRIFLTMDIDAPYTFLTPVKAVIQIAAVIAVAAYVLFLRDRLPSFFNKRLDILIPAGLALVNAVLCVYNPGRYLGNLKSFVFNISHRSGWGLFPMLIIGIYVLCFIVSKGEGTFKYTFADLCFLSYLLTCLAVGFARGDALRESIGDSGNRVLLQVTILAFFAACDHIIALLLPGVKDTAGD
ncbi:MAG: hypothetical protein K6E63_03405 [Lachnospiraceae bacterium]|nr:hypothetical protein [Lachnospiraceae bacterium]